MCLDLSDPQIGVSPLRVLRTRSCSICSYFGNEVARSNVNTKSEIIVTAPPAVCFVRGLQLQAVTNSATNESVIDQEANGCCALTNS